MESMEQPKAKLMSVYFTLFAYSSYKLMTHDHKMTLVLFPVLYSSYGWT
jgi:hypothetical protein